MLKRWFAPISLALLLAACGGPGALPLTVTDLNPEDGATNVAIDVVLSATFSSAIDADTLDGAFTLDADGGAEVAGTAALSADGRTATFTPDADLAYATAYTATVAGTVATTGGTALGGEASWSFTTEDEPLPGALTGADYETTVVVEGDAIDLAADVSGGTAPYAFALAVDDVLPAGVTLDATTGAIAGTPTEVGLFEGVVVVTDDASATADLAYSIDVAAELVGGAYTAYDAPSNIDTEIVMLEPFTGGYGTVTYALTDGALPAAFTTLDVDVPGDYPDYAGAATYEVAFDETTGTIGGSTGAVGTFTGTVTATDELGQTATATFQLVLGFDLAYEDDATQIVSGLAGIVVEGDKVRVNGVPTLALPADFPLMYFEMILAAGSSLDAAQDDFQITVTDGTIQKMADTAAPATWIYDVTVQLGEVVTEGQEVFIAPVEGSTPSEAVTFTFEVPAG